MIKKTVKTAFLLLLPALEFLESHAEAFAHALLDEFAFLVAQWAELL